MKYILAFSVGLPGQGSAIAVLERKPEKGKRHEDWSDDDLVVRHDWLDHHALVYLERIPPEESIPAAAARVRKMLAGTDLAHDSDFVLDLTAYGRGLWEMFYVVEPPAPQYRIVIGGDVETPNPTLGGWTVPERDIRGALTLHAQEQRLKVPEGLALGPSLLRAIENPDATPDRDIYLATAIAVWAGRRFQTGGPWPSSNPPPRGSKAVADSEEVEMNRQREERREQHRREQEQPYWRRGYGRGGT